MDSLDARKWCEKRCHALADSANYQDLLTNLFSPLVHDISFAARSRLLYLSERGTCFSEHCGEPPPSSTIAPTIIIVVTEKGERLRRLSAGLALVRIPPSEPLPFPSVDGGLVHGDVNGTALEESGILSTGRTS